MAEDKTVRTSRKRMSVAALEKEFKALDEYVDKVEKKFDTRLAEIDDGCKEFIDFINSARGNIEELYGGYNKLIETTVAHEQRLNEKDSCCKEEAEEEWDVKLQLFTTEEALHRSRQIITALTLLSIVLGVCLLVALNRGV